MPCSNDTSAFDRTLPETGLKPVFRNYTPEELQAQYSARAAVPEHLRISVGTPEQLDRVVAALAEVLG